MLYADDDRSSRFANNICYMPNGIGRAVSEWQVLCTVHGQWPKTMTGSFQILELTLPRGYLLPTQFSLLSNSRGSRYHVALLSVRPMVECN